MSAAPARRIWPIALLAVAVTTLALSVATFTALFGASVSCLGGGTASAARPSPTGAARQIPPARLHIYMGAAGRFDISWPFLASIGVQECGYDGHCGVASSGCAGVMEIAYVRGSACSPDPSVPTLWERFKVDADGGGASIFDPADAIFTAARIFHEDLSAPPAGGSYQGYYQAACSYYGACADGVADYAHEVMARAVEFGFGQEAESESGKDTEATRPPGRHHHPRRHHGQGHRATSGGHRPGPLRRPRGRRGAGTGPLRSGLAGAPSRRGSPSLSTHG